MSESFSKFLSDVQALVFPDGMPENLQLEFRTNATIALIHVQKYIRFFRSRNKDVHLHCSTLFSCGATVVDKPRGQIQRLYTLQGECCPIFYDWVPDYDVFNNWLISFRRAWTNPSTDGKPALPAGFFFSDASLDKGRRYNYGRYTIHNHRVYIGHRIESSEKVVIEWEGIKKSYEDGDLMPYGDADLGDPEDAGIQLKDIVAEYVRSEHMRIRERSKDWQESRRIFNDKVAELKHEKWAEETPKSMPNPDEGYDQLWVYGDCADDQCETESVEDEEDVFAVIGDWGKPTNPSSDAPACVAVESVIQEWEPAFIVTTGDNRYDCTFEEIFALCQYYESMRERGLFFPALGNHDTDDGGGIDEFLNTFQYLPGDRRNFDIQLGHVHFFFRETHDSGSNIVSAAALTQSAARLRQRLAISQAPWKVVITQDPPYTSDASVSDYPGHTASRLDYRGWGADLVISGDSHYYERLLVDGFPYLICGLSGASRASFNASPVDGSQFRYRDDYGALRGRATCNRLKFEFINTAGVVVDSLELTK